LQSGRKGPNKWKPINAVIGKAGEGFTGIMFEIKRIDDETWMPAAANDGEVGVPFPEDVQVSRNLFIQIGVINEKRSGQFLFSISY
jgi:hypothetical protein